MGNNCSYPHRRLGRKKFVEFERGKLAHACFFFVKNVVEFFFLLSRCKAIYTNNGCKLVKTIT